ncbi:DUF192 domain-containing protein [Allohahella sp. A8]|uniref:DUF192 domain-containing protein n=1 Tax=Allohahella sp. A8 TaxID=3141461 RepID=UPI003A7FCF80
MASSLIIREADTFFGRLRGLMGKASLPEGEALMFTPCSSVHTFFMRFAIDVVYLDKERRIVKICEQLKPWRMSLCFGARSVVELNAGKVGELGWRVGMQPEEVLKCM